MVGFGLLRSCRRLSRESREGRKEPAPPPVASVALNLYHNLVVAMLGGFGCVFFVFGADPLEPGGFLEPVFNLWAKDGGDIANWYAHVVGLLFFIVATAPLFGVPKLAFACWSLLMNSTMMCAMIHGAFNADTATTTTFYGVRAWWQNFAIWLILGCFGTYVVLDAKTDTDAPIDDAATADEEAAVLATRSVSEGRPLLPPMLLTSTSDALPSKSGVAAPMITYSAPFNTSFATPVTTAHSIPITAASSDYASASTTAHFEPAPATYLALSTRQA